MRGGAATEVPREGLEGALGAGFPARGKAGRGVSRGRGGKEREEKTDLAVFMARCMAEISKERAWRVRRGVSALSRPPS